MAERPHLPFRDRRDAGRQLAAALAHLRSDHPIVLGLPRGGVVVAAEAARELGAPLDVLVVRKLGVPVQPELGMGAIGEGGVRVLDARTVRLAGVTSAQIASVEAHERDELERRVRRYRGDRPVTALDDRTVVVVDDGIATGGTARAAVRVVRARAAQRVVVAAPVGAADTVADLAADDAVDAVVVLATPASFRAIGAWYERFDQTSDEEVRALLHPGDPLDAG